MRRRGRRRNSLARDIATAPWQVNLVLGVIAFVVLRWGFPEFFARNIFLKPLANLSITSAPWVAGLLFLVAFYSFLSSAWRRQQNQIIEFAPRPGMSGSSRIDPAPSTFGDGSSNAFSRAPSAVERPTEWSLKLLRELEWKRFEEVCAAFYRELGLRTETIRCGADGGIDAKLFQADSTEPDAIIQCKAWNSRPVGVKPVRELLGVMTHHKVAEGVFMITGDFTQEAVAFAQENPLELVNGKRFLEMIDKLSPEARQRLLNLATEGDYTTPSCPSCGIKMVERSGDNGPFWGCRNYPRCTQVFVLRGSKPPDTR